MTQADKQEEQEVYKVCFTYKADDMTPESVVNNSYTVEYKIGEWVQNEYPLLAFDTLENAQGFISECDRARGYKIFSAVGVVIKPVNRLLKLINMCDSNMRKFWGGRDEGLDWLERVDYLFNAPSGTLACSKIKLLERIEVDD